MHPRQHPGRLSNRRFVRTPYSDRGLYDTDFGVIRLVTLRRPLGSKLLKVVPVLAEKRGKDRSSEVRTLVQDLVL